MKIVTLTLNPALDKSVTVEHLVPEKKMRCENPQTDAGGGGINVSKGIAKLGGTSIAVFPAGGGNGKKLVSLLKKAGITSKTVMIEGETRENFAALDASTHLQYRFTMSGARVDLAVARQCLQTIEKIRPQILVASGSLPPGLPAHFFQEVAAFAKKIHSRLILDTSGEALAAAAREGLYLLKPNLYELSALVGSTTELELNQVDDAALEIVRSGRCEVMVVSLAAQGALVVTRAGFEHIPAPTVQKKSTVGAGDSMVAGIVWAMSRGEHILECVRWGVACGSAATMNMGTQLFEYTDASTLKNWIDTYGERYRIRDFH